MNSTKRIWQFFKPVRFSLYVSATLGALTLISSIALMATSGWLISRAAQMPPVFYLTWAVVAIQVFALLRGLMRYAERLLSHNATFGSLARIHRIIFDRLENLAPAGLPAFRRGDLLARLVSDVDSIQDLPLRVFLPIASGVLAAGFAIGLSSWMLPQAGLTMFLTLLFAATIIPAISMRNAAMTETESAQIRGDFIDELIEFYSGNADIISLGQQDAAIKRLLDLDRQLTKAASKHAYSTGLASGLLHLAQGVAIIVFAWVAIEAFTQGKLDGVFLVVLVLIPIVAFESVSNFPTATLALARVRGSAARIVEILDCEAAVTEPISSREISGYDLQLRAVSARWPQVEEAAISNLNLSVPVNTSIGLVGPSGSGKSTIIALFLKFLSPSEGHYLIDEFDSNDVTGTDIRQRLILSSPEQHIFSTTILENLLIASDDPANLSANEVWLALEQVDLASWVRSLPDQLETQLGERGSTMSGGQRQRLTLARLFIAKPNVWILDEPTEHLDSALADRIMENIASQTRASSLIVASHRTADTEKLDQIVRVNR
jgi:thiol reductant ABC exporter CydC subunit